MSELVRAALGTIVEGGTLLMDDARLAMGAVMDGEATPAQLAAMLMGLRMRGETVEELAGFAAAMRERVTRVDAPPGAIDVVGTGGDGSGTLNISTTAALVVAASGVPVAKHGFGNGRLWKDLRLPAHRGDGPDDLSGSNGVSKPGGSIDKL